MITFTEKETINISEFMERQLENYQINPVDYIKPNFDLVIDAKENIFNEKTN